MLLRKIRSIKLLINYIRHAILSMIPMETKRTDVHRMFNKMTLIFCIITHWFSISRKCEIVLRCFPPSPKKRLVNKASQIEASKSFMENAGRRIREDSYLPEGCDGLPESFLRSVNDGIIHSERKPEVSRHSESGRRDGKDKELRQMFRKGFVVTTRRLREKVKGALREGKFIAGISEDVCQTVAPSCVYADSFVR